MYTYARAKKIAYSKMPEGSKELLGVMRDKDIARMFAVKESAVRGARLHLGMRRVRSVHHLDRMYVRVLDLSEDGKTPQEIARVMGMEVRTAYRFLWMMRKFGLIDNGLPADSLDMDASDHDTTYTHGPIRDLPTPLLREKLDGTRRVA